MIIAVTAKEWTVRRMTDNEIIKALECCAVHKCSQCPLQDAEVCTETDLMKEAINLITRQQAEIKRLRRLNNILEKNADTAFQDGLNEAQDLYAKQIEKEIRLKTVLKL